MILELQRRDYYHGNSKATWMIIYQCNDSHVDHIKHLLIAQYSTKKNPYEKQLVSNISQSKTTETPGWPLSNGRPLRSMVQCHSNDPHTKPHPTIDTPTAKIGKMKRHYSSSTMTLFIMLSSILW
jgi:hypothetical protein